MLADMHRNAMLPRVTATVWFWLMSKHLWDWLFVVWSLLVDLFKNNIDMNPFFIIYFLHFCFTFHPTVIIFVLIWNHHVYIVFCIYQGSLPIFFSPERHFLGLTVSITLPWSFVQAQARDFQKSSFFLLCRTSSLWNVSLIFYLGMVSTDHEQKQD